jgi:DNA-binding transcriptional LysR family regulator
MQSITTAGLTALHCGRTLLATSTAIRDDHIVVDLKKMRSFVVLAEELHFGRAASRLSIVQPALTQHIRQLEADLGVGLLDRSSRRVTLTAAGEVFLVEARKALSQVNHAAQSARDTAKGLAGNLNIGFVDNAVWSVLPNTLREFRARFPAVELNLRQLARAAQLTALLQGELDIAILPGPVSRSGVVTQLLSRAPIDIALPAQHRLCELKEIPVAKLANESFISFPSAVDARRIDELILAICAEAGFTPVLGQAVQQMHTALALVSTGAGIAFVPRWMRRAWQENVEYRALSPLTHYELQIVTLAARTRPAIERFREIAAHESRVIE